MGQYAGESSELWSRNQSAQINRGVDRNESSITMGQECGSVLDVWELRSVVMTCLDGRSSGLICEN
jgi:hypothetical protein